MGDYDEAVGQHLAGALDLLRTASNDTKLFAQEKIGEILERLVDRVIVLEREVLILKANALRQSIASKPEARWCQCGNKINPSDEFEALYGLCGDCR